jgi:hypothetical protein
MRLLDHACAHEVRLGSGRLNLCTSNNPYFIISLGFTSLATSVSTSNQLQCMGMSFDTVLSRLKKDVSLIVTVIWFSKKEGSSSRFSP